MEKRKIILAAVVIAIIVLAVVSIAIISVGEKKTDRGQKIATQSLSSSSWETYQSEDGFFEFQYPQDWNIVAISESGFDANKIIPAKQQYCLETEAEADLENWCLDVINFGLFFSQRLAGVSSLDELKQVVAEEFQWSDVSRLGNFSQFELSGKRAIRFSIPNQTEKGENYFVWIPVKENIYLSLNAAYLDNQQKQVFEKIVSSVEIKN